MFNTNLTWQKVKKRCGRLAVMDSAEKYKFVVGLVEKSKVVEAWHGAPAATEMCCSCLWVIDARNLETLASDWVQSTAMPSVRRIDHFR